MAQKKKKKKKSTARTILVALLIILIVVMDLGLVGYAAVKYLLYSKSNYVEDASVTVDVNFVEHMKEEMGEDYEIATLESDEEEKIMSIFQVVFQEMETHAAVTEAVDEAPAETAAPQAQTYNLLLIGSDRREGGYYGNSDVMVLFTVNESRQTIYMTSFMRDLFANIPGFGVSKMNAAYAKGGGPLLVQTLTSNYGVRVDNYASVDFGSTAAIIDLVGGVDVEVDAAEAGAAYIPIPSNGAGTLTHLNGTEAVAYARIRYVGNADFGRTARQREVITNVISRLRGMGVGDWMGMANAVLPLTTHNISMDTLSYIVSRAPSWIGYNLVELRVPFDGHYYSSNEILIPDADYTIRTLLGTLYY